MNPSLVQLMWTSGLTAAALLVVAASLSLVPRRACDALCRAPMLDGLVAYFTWIPWVAAAVFAGWIGLGGALLGQFIALYVWAKGHELAHPTAARGPRIIRFINAAVGRWQNHLALWVTLVALPAFWLIRLIQAGLWWTLVMLLDFPRYRQGDWINVSRHKFDGLIGHDLVWCLYCDWMTGVYSLGAEMLRNVESFWCPIRFYDGKKCANCAVDFPDIDGGWVEPDKTMGDVVTKMQEMYGDGRREWFGHPARRIDLTVNGQPISEPEPVACATGE